MSLDEILKNRVKILEEELRIVRIMEKNIWKELNYTWETQYQIGKVKNPSDIIIKEGDKNETYI